MLTDELSLSRERGNRMLEKMNKVSIRILAILISLFMVITLFGCSNQTNTSSNSADEGETTEKSSDTEETAELEYWIAGDPRRTPVYQESVDLFMEKFENIKVEVIEEVGDNTQIQQKLMAMISTGSAPGLIHVDTMYVADMARAGTIVSLSDFDGALELSDQIFEGAQEPLIIEDEIYGYPIRANSVQLVYNKQMFRDVGLDPEKPPVTYEQVIEYAEALTKYDDDGNVLVYGIEAGLSSDPHWTSHVFTPILWSFGGGYLDDDGNAALNSQAAYDAAEYWKTILLDKELSPSDRITQGFQNEQVAMVITGEWEIRAYKEDFPNLDFGFATLPVPDESVTPQIPLGGRACVIPKNVEYENAAWELLKWVMSDEEQMRYTSNEVGLTPKNTLLDDPWFDDNLEYKHCLDDMKYVRAKAAPDILQMNTILGNALQEIYINGADIQGALDAANEEYNDVLKN